MHHRSRKQKGFIATISYEYSEYDFVVRLAHVHGNFLDTALKLWILKFQTAEYALTNIFSYGLDSW